MAYRYMFAIVGGALLYIVTLKVFLRPDADHPVGCSIRTAGGATP
jgi:hypothetical protein